MKSPDPGSTDTAGPPRRKTWTAGRLARLSGLTLMLYGVWVAYLGCGQHRMFYPGAYARLAPEEARVPSGTQQIWIETEPGVRVEGWYSPLLGPDGKPVRAPAVLLAHGNYECIDNGQYFVEQFHRFGFHALSAEYRGYGRSTGTPSQPGMTRDIVAFHDWLAARPEVEAERIVHYGWSLGAAVISQCAAARKPAAIILDSAFSSAVSMASRYFVPTALLSDHWRTDVVLAGLGVPALLIHGRGDTVIPVSEARALQQVAPGSRLIEHAGAHTDLTDIADEYWRWVSDYLHERGLMTEPRRP